MANTNPSRLKLALAASLILNLFVAGVVLGASVMYMRADMDRRDALASRSQAETLWGISERLTPVHRDQFQAYLRKRSDQMADRIVVVRAARLRARDAVTSNAYSPQTLTTALADTRKGEFALRNDLDGDLAKFLTTLSPDERRILAASVVAGRIGRPADAVR